MELFKREKRAAGLDIGSYSIKAVELLRRANQISLSGAGVEKLASKDRPGIVAALKNVLDKSKISSRNVGVAISGQSVIVRYVVLPMMTMNELRSSLVFEAEKHIPFKVEEMQLDCRILATGLEGSKMRVLLVGARKDAIENLVSILNESGLAPAFIDIDGFCVSNGAEFALFPECKEKVCALLNVGHSFTNISIVNNFSACFSRDVAAGGADMIEAVKEKSGSAPGEIESLLSDRREDFDEVHAAAKPTLERLLGEIRVSFDYYESQYEKGIDRVFLSGGCAKIGWLGKYLSDALGVDVTSWDPLLNVMMPPGLQANLEGVGQEMAVAVGLAVRGLKI